MSIKNVVKVMNFHSLIRVDKSRRKAAMYFDTEEELLKLIKKVMFNRNMILDKKLLTPNEKADILNVYIGNDLGFCGDFNFSVNKEVRRDHDYKVIIGRKIHYFSEDEKVLLYQSKEDFFQDFSKLQDIIVDGVSQRKYREINVIYNHYYNMNHLEFTKKKLYPFDYGEMDEGVDYNEDFALETDIHSLVSNLIALYVCYELKICEINSYAAENVIRQQLTSESLKKIDELEEEKTKAERKVRKQKDFQKIIENYRKG